jgi:glycosyltransferase involved in cell wall biosynthesis
MKIAIVHDDLVQWGGAERMLLGLSEAFPDAPIYTSVFDKEHKILCEQFSGKKIITSFMQKIPWWRRLYKPLFFLYPIAFEQFDFSEYDVVISQTTRFAKSIITKPETVHLCYMHTPPRFLYQFSQERLSLFLKPILPFLRMFDQVSGTRPDFYLAGSKNAQNRIKKIYGKESKVLYPFVDASNNDISSSFGGGYYLVISRLNKYKNVDVVIKACNRLKKKLKVVGRGPEYDHLKNLGNQNIEFLNNLPEDFLKNVIAGCKALIVAAEEDFGLTPLEAQSFGKPVIALKKGGALETVIEGNTGVFFDEPTITSLAEGIERFEKMNFNVEDCRKNAESFSKERFVKEVRSFVEKYARNHETERSLRSTT